MDRDGAEKTNLELIADKVELLAKGKATQTGEPTQTEQQQQLTL